MPRRRRRGRPGLRQKKGRLKPVHSHCSRLVPPKDDESLWRPTQDRERPFIRRNQGLPDSINAQKDMGGVPEASIDPGSRDPMMNHRHGAGTGRYCQGL